MQKSDNLRKGSAAFQRPVALLRGLLYGVLCAISLYSLPAFAATTLPTKMNFQGRLTNSAGDILTNGTYNMRFKIYDTASGGSVQWSEDRLVSAGQGVTVSNGQFSVQLGSVSSLPASIFASNSRYFEVELPTPATATSSSPSWTEGPMSPRNQLATSAYAYNAETLDGIDGSSFGQLSTANTWTNTNTFRPSSNSTSSFAIQASDSTNLLIADSSNSRVYIGNSTADSTGVVLVLDTKNTTGDPTGVDGAMYYNSSLRSFRCHQGGAWRACIGGLVASNIGTSTLSNTSTSEFVFPNTYTIPANNCVPGRVYRVTARGTYSAPALPPNVTVRLKADTITLAATGAVGLSSVSDRQWSLNADVICQTTGATGTVEAAGTYIRSTGVNAANMSEMVNTAAITIDTTVAQTLQMSVQWGGGGGTSTQTLRQFTVEAMGP